MQTLRFASTCLMTSLFGTAGAETIELKNGDTLSGNVLRIETDFVYWDSTTFGELTVPANSVSKIDGEPFHIASLRTAEESSGKDKLSITGDFGLEFDFGFEKDAGPSDSEEVDVRLKGSYERGLVWASMRVEHESEAQGDNSTGEDYEVEIKAERYFESAGIGPYWYVLSGWNKDRFRTIESWTTLGSGVGYSWQKSENTRLKVQAGLDGWLTSSEFVDRTATGGRVVVDIRRTIPSIANIAIFTEAQFLWEIAGRSNRLFETSSGVRLPLSERFFAQLSLDYDRFEFADAPEFAENDETEWNFRVGARWD